MIWSKFNILYETPQGENFLYNSRNNVFLKLEKDLYVMLQEIEKGNRDIEMLSLNVINFFEEKKIIVKKNEDSGFINQMKYLKRKKSFLNDTLKLIIAPTLACNFACPYCYEKDLPTHIMSENIQNQLISFINSQKDKVDKLTIDWHGGEPLIGYKAIQEILCKISEESSIPLKQHRMVSNGYLFTKAKCDFFRNTKLDYLQITIDGTKENHNQTRIHKQGLDTYDVIINNVDMILSTMPDCNVGIRVNIHENNKSMYPFIYEELYNRWKDKNCFIYPAIVLKQGACNIPCLSSSERAKFYLELHHKYHHNVDFTPHMRLGSCDGIYENSYIIDPQGCLYKCWADIGIKERSIGDLKDGVNNWEFVAGYMFASDKFEDQKCLDCKIFPICDGGCNRFRIEHQYKGIPFDVCPIDDSGLVGYLDTIYNHQKNESFHVES